MTDHLSFSDSFSKFVPGFEFLQGLVKNAGQTLPSIGQWVAPTLDPAELERRINELRTVQFWLEQNAKMIGTTVQALEVQRMTLGTLKTMNVQMGDLGEALKVRPMGDLFQAAANAASPSPAAAPPPAPAPAPAPSAGTAESAAAPGVDPMQWWGALTQQFTELATQAMQATSEATSEAQARAAEALKATTEAAAQAQARASEAMAEAVKDAVSTAAETVAAPKKAAARKSAAKPASAAPAPAPDAVASKAAAAKTAARPARKSSKA